MVISIINTVAKAYNNGSREFVIYTVRDVYTWDKRIILKSYNTLPLPRIYSEICKAEVERRILV